MRILRVLLEETTTGSLPERIPLGLSVRDDVAYGWLTWGWVRFLMGKDKRLVRREREDEDIT